jgi:hypothetical protein
MRNAIKMSLLESNFLVCYFSERRSFFSMKFDFAEIFSPYLNRPSIVVFFRLIWETIYFLKHSSIEQIGNVITFQTFQSIYVNLLSNSLFHISPRKPTTKNGKYLKIKQTKVKNISLLYHYNPISFFQFLN